MNISWLGNYTIKITVGDTTLIVDPYAPTAGLSTLRAKAEIVALSNPSNPEMSHISAIQGVEHVIKTPGEYALADFTLHALGWYDDNGVERNIQRWHVEDMTLLHVGALNRELTDQELQEIEKTVIDILFLPIGGGLSLSTPDALKLLSTIEPRVVIPVNYKLPGLKNTLEGVDKFAKEMGVDLDLQEKKYSIKANKLPQEDLQTVILVP